MMPSGNGNLSAPNHIDDLMNACVRIGVLELQDGGIYHLMLSIFTIVKNKHHQSYADWCFLLISESFLQLDAFIEIVFTSGGMTGAELAYVCLFLLYIYISPI